MPSVLSTDAFAQRSVPLRPALLRTAFALVGASDADDLVQETLCRALVTIARFDADADQAALLSWLSTILGHVYAESVRTTAREIPTDPLALLDLADAEAGSILGYDPLEPARQLLLELVERASLTRLQELCVRLWLNGLTQQDIASHLMISQPAVSQHIALAKEALARLRVETQAVDPGRRHWFEDVSNETIYRGVSDVWDREGTAENVQARRDVKAQERYERRRRREGYPQC